MPIFHNFYYRSTYSQDSIKKRRCITGDRANIKIIDGDKYEMYFYTHWSGTRLPKMLKQALLRGKNRWHDAQYLGRIIFCEIIQDEPLSETGAGLSTQIGDGFDKVIDVYIEADEILIDGKTYTFEEYVTWDDPQWVFDT